MSAILALEGISKSFGAVVIADDLDLQLAEGEALGMLGPNGAGKTTLFGIITGMLAPNSGRVLFEGRDITRLSAAERCRLGVARSFQIPQPFGGMSVFENLVVAGAFAKGRREQDVYDLCAQILEDCELADKANVKGSVWAPYLRRALSLCWPAKEADAASRHHDRAGAQACRRCAIPGLARDRPRCRESGPAWPQGYRARHRGRILGTTQR